MKYIVKFKNELFGAAVVDANYLKTESGLLKLITLSASGTEAIVGIFDLKAVEYCTVLGENSDGLNIPKELEIEKVKESRTAATMDKGKIQWLPLSGQGIIFITECPGHKVEIISHFGEENVSPHPAIENLFFVKNSDFLITHPGAKYPEILWSKFKADNGIDGKEKSGYMAFEKPTEKEVKEIIATFGLENIEFESVMGRGIEKAIVRCDSFPAVALEEEYPTLGWGDYISEQVQAVEDSI